MGELSRDQFLAHIGRPIRDDIAELEARAAQMYTDLMALANA